MFNLPRGLRSCIYFLFSVCPILFFTDLTRNPYYTQIVLLNMATCVAWILILVYMWRSSEGTWAVTALDPALWVLMAWCLLSWGQSFVAHPNFTKSIYSEGSKAIIFLIVNSYLVYALSVRSQDKGFLYRLLWVTYAVSVTASIYGLAQYFGEEWIWPRNLNPYGSRPVSTFGNPNFMSSYLVLVIPVMAADYLYKLTGMPRVLLFGGVMASFGALLATLTRSSWAGALVGLVIVACVVWKQRKDSSVVLKAAGILALGFIAITVFWPRSDAGYSATVIERVIEVKNVTKEHYGSAWQRFLIWMSAWTMILDHPFAGKGWGCFELFYPFYQGSYLVLEAFRGLRTHANNAHNEILEYWSQIGTIGLGIIVWMWAVIIRFGWSLSRRLSGGHKVLAWGFLGGIAGMLVDNLLNVSVHFAVPAFMFWWWMGCLFVLDPLAVRFVRFPISRFWQRGVIVFGIVGLVMLIARAGCLWMQEVYFFKGFKMSKAGVDLIAASQALERARFWHALEVNNNYELANVYARLGEKDKALVMYQKALDANAGYDEIYFNRATLNLQMNRPEEALGYYQRVLAINPLSHDSYNALANLYFKDVGRYGSLIEPLYLQAVTIFPKDRDLWNNLGVYYTQKMEWEKAISAYKKALEIDPGFQLAQKNLEVIATRQGGVLKH